MSVAAPVHVASPLMQSFIFGSRSLTSLVARRAWAPWVVVVSCASASRPKKESLKRTCRLYACNLYVHAPANRYVLKRPAHTNNAHRSDTLAFRSYIRATLRDLGESKTYAHARFWCCSCWLLAEQVHRAAAAFVVAVGRGGGGGFCDALQPCCKAVVSAGKLAL